MKPADFRRLVAAGLSTEQVAVVMEMFEEREEVRKADQRARWRKWRSTKENANVSQRELTAANNSRAGATRVEDKPLTTEIEHKEVRKEDKKEASATPRSELERVLDSDHAGWVIDHRQRLRKPLTVRAANQLAGKLEKCPEPNVAADLMVERGWLSVDPSWLTNGHQARGSPPLRGLAAVTERFKQRLSDDYDSGRKNDNGAEPHGGLPVIAGTRHRPSD